MVPYLLSEDQRLSLLFLVFYICQGWHNISDDSISFHQRIPHENAFIFKHLFLPKLKHLQIISMLPSHMEFHSVIFPEHQEANTPFFIATRYCFVPFLPTKPFT